MDEAGRRLTIPLPGTIGVDLQTNLEGFGLRFETPRSLGAPNQDTWKRHGRADVDGADVSATIYEASSDAFNYRPTGVSGVQVSINAMDVFPGVPELRPTLDDAAVWQIAVDQFRPLVRGLAKSADVEAETTRWLQDCLDPAANPGSGSSASVRFEPLRFDISFSTAHVSMDISAEEPARAAFAVGRRECEVEAKVLGAEALPGGTLETAATQYAAQFADPFRTPAKNGCLEGLRTVL